MKGLFIPDITAEMFRNGCLESIESLMAEGEIYDIEYNKEPHWIPFHKRLLTEEEQKEHKDWCWILDCELPDDNQEVLISSPYFGVYIDTFYNDDGCSFDGGEEIKEGMAWMPLPEPYKKEGDKDEK